MCLRTLCAVGNKDSKLNSYWIKEKNVLKTRGSSFSSGVHLIEEEKASDALCPLHGAYLCFWSFKASLQHALFDRGTTFPAHLCIYAIWGLIPEHEPAHQLLSTEPLSGKLFPIIVFPLNTTMIYEHSSRSDRSFLWNWIFVHWF